MIIRNAEWYKADTKSYKANRGIRPIDLIPAVSLYLGSELSIETSIPMKNLLHLFLICYHRTGTKSDFRRSHVDYTKSFLNNFVLVTNWGRRYLGCPYEQNFMSSSLMIPIKRLLGFVGKSVLIAVIERCILTAGAVYLFNENINDAFLSHTFKNTPSMFAAGIGVSYRIDEQQ